MLGTTIFTFTITINLRTWLLKPNDDCAFLETHILLSTKTTEAFAANTLLF